MKYFTIEVDEESHVPYNINLSRAIDIRHLTRENIHKVKRWTLVDMALPMEVFFPDILCFPFIMVSETFLRTIILYYREVVYRSVKLWHRESGCSASYFIPILNEPDCLSETTQYNTPRTRITRLVLDRGKIGTESVFRVKGDDRKRMIGREDFVESILRRDVRGIRLEEVEVEESIHQYID